MKKLTLIVITLVALAASSFLWSQPVPEELIYWDFQQGTAPAEVSWYIMNASNVSISTGQILIMNGNDGGNSRVGWAPDTLWTQETQLNPAALPEKYIEFSFRPRLNYAVHLTEMEFRFGRNELGPRAFAAAISADDFQTGQFFLSQEITSEDPNSLDGFMFDFQGGFFRYIGPNRKLSIRIWAYGALPDNDNTIDPADNTTWPYLMMNNFRVNGFIVPFPVLAFVLDRTGSMGNRQGGLNYWPGAKQRAQVFIDQVLMDLDAVCVVSYAVEDFESDDYEDHANADWPMKHSPIKLSRIWPVATQPDTTVRKVQIIDEIDDIDDPNFGRTSIGSGLLVARNELLDAYGKLPGKAAIILMSDGFDNWNPMARHVLPIGNPQYDNMPDSIAIFTIALGGVADGPLLRAIARSRDGEYVMANNVQQMTDLYFFIYYMGIEQLQNHYSSYQSIAGGERHLHDVIVDDKTEHIKFFMVTEEEDINRQTTDIGFSLVSPSGRIIDAMAAEDIAGITYTEGFAAKSFELFLPEKGVWQFVVSGNAIAQEENYQVMAYGHSAVRLGLEVVEYEPAINDPVNFVVTLKDKDLPIRNGQVTVNVFPPPEDTRNYHYYDVDGTPFAEYQPELTISSRFPRTRNPEEPIPVELTETEPGVYRGTFTEATALGSYNLRVVAGVDNDEYHFNRQTLASIVVTEPARISIPHLAQPAHEAESVETNVAFLWNDVFEADSYHFQLANRQEILIDMDGLEENRIVIDSLDYNREYMWRVKAISGDRESYWSGVWHFTTGLPEMPAPHTLEASVLNYGIALNWESPELEHDFYGSLFSFWIYRNEQFVGGTHPLQTNFTDHYAYPGNLYRYYVQAAYGEQGEWLSPPSNIVEVMMTGIEDEDLPVVTGIRGNYPNPFNPETTVMFGMTDAGYAEITVYNIAGQKVRTLVNEELPAGNHSVVWDARDDRNRPVTSGIYMIKMQTAGYTGQSKVLLLK